MSDIPITPEVVPEQVPVRRHFTDETLLEVLKACGGYRSIAARKLGVSPSCVRKRIANNPKLREAAEDAEIEIVDLAQNELAKKIKEGDLTAIIFTLKCKGGWCEKNEIRIDGIDERPPLAFILPTREQIASAKETKRLIAENDGIFKTTPREGQDETQNK